MKVKELIAELQEQDPEVIVYYLEEAFLGGQNWKYHHKPWIQIDQDGDVLIRRGG